MYRDIKLTEEEKNELFNSLKDDIINDQRMEYLYTYVLNKMLLLIPLLRLHFR